MTKYVIAWGIGMPATFAFFMLASWFIKFCSDHKEQWWGGFPLWMAGAIWGLVPLAILIVYVIDRIIRG